jgi:hypothetical protein
MTPETWSAMVDESDSRTFGRTFAQMATSKSNFSVILAVPIQTESGLCVGAMTMNVESSVRDAMSKVANADVEGILKVACADAGNLVLS